MNTQDEFLSPKQIADLAGCAYITVLNKIKAGELNALSMGGNFAIRRDEALAWIEIGGEEVSEENLKLLERRVAAVRAALAKQGA